MPSTPDDDLDLEAIGIVFRLAREKADRSQTDVAAAAGTHQPTLSDIERGLATNVSARLLHRIARQNGFALTIVPVVEAPTGVLAGLGAAS